MNPNRISRDLRNIPGNVRSDRFPGGSLIAGVLDRMLMTWSDRGGASRIFGEIWSEHCWSLLSNGSPALLGQLNPSENRTILRLDANPRIAIQAGRHKLPNPDFLVIGESVDRTLTVQAIDAKFAIDRVRRTQISPESIRELVELSGSLVRKEIQERLAPDAAAEIDYVAGAFLGPRSLMNDYFYQSLTTGENPRIPESEIQLIEVDATNLFESTAEFELMSILREHDRMDRSDPATDLVAGMYYLRLASAARWFEQQSRMPLLSLAEPDPIPDEKILQAARTRMRSDFSAYEVIEAWSNSANEAVERQSRVRDAARVPVRMSEIRKLVARAGFGDDKKRVRLVRGQLERRFIQRLVEEVGEIPANPQQSISDVVDRIRQTSRQLKPETMRNAVEIVERFAAEENTAETSGR